MIEIKQMLSMLLTVKVCVCERRHKGRLCVLTQVRPLRDDIIITTLLLFLSLFSPSCPEDGGIGLSKTLLLKTRYVTQSRSWKMARYRERWRAETAALDGAGGGWMRPRLSSLLLSPVKSHGRTRKRTETGGDSTRGE